MEEYHCPGGRGIDCSKPKLGTVNTPKGRAWDRLRRALRMHCSSSPFGASRAGANESNGRDGRDGRDKYREELINEKSFFEVLCRRLLFIKLQPIIPLGELALHYTFAAQSFGSDPSSSGGDLNAYTATQSIVLQPLPEFFKSNRKMQLSCLEFFRRKSF